MPRELAFLVGPYRQLTSLYVNSVNSRLTHTAVGLDGHADQGSVKKSMIQPEAEPEVWVLRRSCVGTLGI